MRACWKAFMSLVSGPFSVSIGQDRLDAVADGAGQVREPHSKILRGGDDFEVPQRKG